MVDINNLQDWLFQSIKSVQKTGETQDIHLNEIEDFSISKQSFTMNKILLFSSKLEKLLLNQNTEGVGIYIAIDLNPKKKLGSSPQNLIEIDDERDFQKTPELIIYKPYKPELPSLYEFYRTPVFINSELSNSNFIVFYKEHREKLNTNNQNLYTREINLIYFPQHH